MCVTRSLRENKIIIEFLYDRKCKQRKKSKMNDGEEEEVEDALNLG